MSVFAQVSNVLNRDNALTYMGSNLCGVEEALCQGLTGEFDEFERGLPILPVVGVRMAF
jgi:hypothetical protein